jgi:hypothetical protein
VERKRRFPERVEAGFGFAAAILSKELAAFSK